MLGIYHWLSYRKRTFPESNLQSPAVNVVTTKRFAVKQESNGSWSVVDRLSNEVVDFSGLPLTDMGKLIACGAELALNLRYGFDYTPRR